MKNVKVVIGANFGDEGKGLMTDYFAAQSVGSCLVVLHNGGAQRGHTVVTPEGFRHVFHHFGCGTFAGADTYCAEEFVVNPALFREEYEKLAKHGHIHNFYINPKCKLTTIYDMLINQAIELDRGTAKHGSCGIGVFETLYRNQKGIDFVAKFTKYADAMTVGEFAGMSIFEKIHFLSYLRDEYVPRRFNELGLHKMNQLFEDVLKSDNALMNYIDDFQFMIEHSACANEALFDSYNTVIFEGAQGLLLDQHNMDYFPHLTPSNTGMLNPATILANYGWTGDVEVCYVSRTYMTRHGVGRFDTECDKALINKNMIDMTNVPNPFQDVLRYGTLNTAELYTRCFDDANSVANIGHFRIQAGIALTHINEYDCGCIFGETYFSNGMTRDDVHIRKDYIRK